MPKKKGSKAEQLKTQEQKDEELYELFRKVWLRERLPLGELIHKIAHNSPAIVPFFMTNEQAITAMNRMLGEKVVVEETEMKKAVREALEEDDKQQEVERSKVKRKKKVKEVIPQPPESDEELKVKEALQRIRSK